MSDLLSEFKILLGMDDLARCSPHRSDDRYMPFGGNKWSEGRFMSYAEMVSTIRERFPDIAEIQDGDNETSKPWQVPGFAGRVGFITSMSNHFCGSCNRLRLTADGNLKVSLSLTRVS